MCKCGNISVYKTADECKRCYDIRRHLDRDSRVAAWRKENGISKYKYMSKPGLRAEIDRMEKQLCTLAKRECDNCQDHDCANCWAKDYK